MDQLADLKKSRLLHFRNVLAQSQPHCIEKHLSKGRMDVQADMHDLHSVIRFLFELGAYAVAELGVVEVLFVSRLG